MREDEVLRKPKLGALQLAPRPGMNQSINPTMWLQICICYAPADFCRAELSVGAL